MDAVGTSKERADVILTVRLNKEVKEKATRIIERKNLTLSAVVQRFFDAIVQTGEVPYLQESERPSSEEIELRLTAMNRFHTKLPLDLTDHEIKAARIKERYGIDLG